MDCILYISVGIFKILLISLLAMLNILFQCISQANLITKIHNHSKTDHTLIHDVSMELNGCQCFNFDYQILLRHVICI